jgi:hypothetical protein
MYEILKKAIRFIAGRCDGAVAQDNVGFMQAHAPFGNWVAQQPIWKLRWAKKARHFLRLYKNSQLPLIGVVYDEIPDPATEGDEWLINHPPAKPLTIADLEGLDWSEPKLIEKLGKTVEEAPISESFWKLWEKKKSKLKDLGYGCSRYSGDWKITRWREVEKEPEPEPEPVPTDDEIFNSLDLDPLYDYQQEHAKKLIKAITVHGVALDGSSTGTGKTYTACVVARNLGLRPLIIDPKAVSPGWRKTLDTLGMEFLGISNYALARTGKVQVKTGVYTRGRNKGFPKYESQDCEYITREINPKKGQYEPKYVFKFNIPEDGIVIFDEAHRCKNRDTQNAQLMRAAKRSGCKILMLTATLTASPLKMDAPGFALGLHESKWDFYNWAKDHGAHKSRFGWVFNNSKKMMRKIHDEIYTAGKGSRMDVNELIAAGKFPESNILAEVFNMNGNTALINEIYSKMGVELAKIADKRKEMGQAGRLTELAARQKARQEVEMLKVPFLVDFTKDVVGEGKSVVIFVNYTATLDALCKQLDTRCTIYGGNNSTTNEANRLAFQANKEHVIVCNVAAAREGIDLHDERQERERVALITPDDNAQNVKQCLGRVHRAGGTPSTQYVIFAADTIEEKVCNNVRGKIARIDVLNDGDLEIPYQF